MRKTLVSLSVLILVLLFSAGYLHSQNLFGLAAADAAPSLSIPSLIPASSNSTVTVPVIFAANGNSIASVVFSLDYDQAWLSINPADGNGDGTPDVVTLFLPAGFSGGCTLNPADLAGELDCWVLDLSVPLNALPNGTLAQVQFQTGNPAVITDAFVNFSLNSPPTSFGNTEGQSVPGSTQNGSVRIIPATPTATLFLTSTATPTRTPTRTPTPTAILPRDKFAFLPLIRNEPPPTATPTPTPTRTPTVTLTPTRTPTPTRTSTSTSTKTPTITPTKTPIPCSNLIKNGGFENVSDWEIPVTEYSAAYSTDVARSGNWSMRTGIVNPAHNKYSYSSARQLITIPFGATKARLNFYYYPISGESPLQALVFHPKHLLFTYAPNLYDTQYVVVTTANNIYLETIFSNRSNSRTWTYQIIDLLKYSGQSIKIEFGTFNNGTDGITAMYVDDVAVDYCP